MSSEALTVEAAHVDALGVDGLTEALKGEGLGRAPDGVKPAPETTPELGGVCPVTHAHSPGAVSEASRRSASRPVRYALVAFGVVCVGLGAAGAVLPGLPTTIFLILASWCFARSCPWLEDRLIRNRLFRPFLKYLEPGATMPARAKVIVIAIIWVSIAVSVTSLVAGGAAAGALLPGSIIGAGVIGSVCVARFGAGRKRSAIEWAGRGGGGAGDAA